MRETLFLRLSRLGTFGEESGLLLKNRRLALAVSGGLDSTALFDFFCHFRERLGLSGVLLVHVNYGLRGAESDGDAAFVEELAKNRGIASRILRVDSLADGAGTAPASGIQEWARELRYKLFQELVDDGWIVATAHSEDDLCENLIFRMARGAAPAHLLGMSPLRLGIWRPFLKLSRKDLEAYQKALALPYREDSSNTKLVYTRNLIRHRILPPLKEQFPGCEERMVSLAREIEDLSRFVSETFADKIQAAVATGVLPWELISPAMPGVQLILLRSFLDAMLERSRGLSQKSVAERELASENGRGASGRRGASNQWSRSLLYQILENVHRGVDTLPAAFEIVVDASHSLGFTAAGLVLQKRSGQKKPRAQQHIKSLVRIDLRGQIAPKTMVHYSGAGLWIAEGRGLVVENVGNTLQSFRLISIASARSAIDFPLPKMKTSKVKSMMKEDHVRMLLCEVSALGMSRVYLCDGRSFFDPESLARASEQDVGLRVRY